MESKSLYILIKNVMLIIKSLIILFILVQFYVGLFQLVRWRRMYSTQTLLPLVIRTEHISIPFHFPMFLVLFFFSCLRFFIVKAIIMKFLWVEMLVYSMSISLPIFNLIDFLTTEIYYCAIKIKGNTATHIVVG